MYRHIIWDFDGTLFDTYPITGSMFQKLLEENGIHEPLTTIIKNMKVSMTHAVQHYIKQYHISDAFLQEFQERSYEAELRLSKPFEGIEEICRYIHASGRYNYLYTHRGESAILLLDRFGLKDSFRDFITSQHGFARKPSPDAIRHLSSKYKMKPEEAIMIGDRDLDIQAAVNAGIHTCYFREYGESVKADYEITGFSQLYDIL